VDFVGTPQEGKENYRVAYVASEDMG